MWGSNIPRIENILPSLFTVSCLWDAAHPAANSDVLSDLPNACKGTQRGRSPSGKCSTNQTIHYMQMTLFCLETWPESGPAVAFKNKKKQTDKQKTPDGVFSHATITFSISAQTGLMFDSKGKCQAHFYLDECELLGYALPAPELATEATANPRSPLSASCLHPPAIQTYPTHRIDFIRTCDLPLVSLAGITLR